SGDVPFAPNITIASIDNGVGNQKAILTTKDSFTTNRIDLKLIGQGYALIKDIRIFELPAGSEIENDFETMTADELAIKYPFVRGTKSTIGSARISSADDTGEVKDKAYVTAVKDNKIVNLMGHEGIHDEIDLGKG